MPISRHIPSGTSRFPRVLEAILLLAATAFFALHFVHMKADFPNNSPWMDWSKYTDEGWYGDAAIRHFQLGHWYLPGDFNPAAALPVWPLVEAVVFRFTGVTLAAARALTVCVFGAILMASYLLLWRWERPGRKTIGPSIAVLLLAVSPFCFVFTRMAIIEPFLVLLMLLALHVASTASGVQWSRGWFGWDRSTGLLGLLIPAMILTKTTAAFLLPAIAYLLWAAVGYRLRPFLRVAIPANVLAAVIWLSYFLLVVRPHFLKDYQYLFSANGYTGITAATVVTVLMKTVRDGLWIGELLYPLALGALVIALARPRFMRQNPLVPTFLLWAAGYAAFLAYHDNLQPRYYLVIAVPLTLLVAVVFQPVRSVLFRSHHTPRHAIFATLTTLVLTITLIADARQTIDFVRHPEYTLLNAVTNVTNIIKADPTHKPLVLSISGSDISLMTGLPSIDDDFGTLELVDRVKQYRPGWYAAWNQIDDDKMDALTPLYRPVRVAEFPAMDDPDRNLLILYRLDEQAPPPKVTRGRKPIPRRLQTKIGQQPSVVQLEH